MNDSNAENNKAIVLEAFETLFNKRDYAAAERFWSPNYIQHSAHIEPGRDGLFNLIKSIPGTLKYEPGVILAEGDFVIIHRRFSGIGLPVNWIAADIIRMKDGVLLEHWTSFRTRLPRNSPKAETRCLVTRSPTAHSHTDALTVVGGFPGLTFPRVPGHEVIEKVQVCKAGKKVSGWAWDLWAAIAGIAKAVAVATSSIARINLFRVHLAMAARPK
jgi:predicted SnoaL-like aldol condensation-catalyzing enzyme